MVKRVVVKFRELGPGGFTRRSAGVGLRAAQTAVAALRRLLKGATAACYRWRARRRLHRAFPGSRFVGPYERSKLMDSAWFEQWLWAHRDLIRGDVLDMSTPRTLHAHLFESPRVKNVKVSDLHGPVVEKLGHSSPADIIGDFCAPTLPVPEESFDTVLCLSILEHCEDPQAMVRNIRRLLRPEGIALVYCPFAYTDGHMSPDYWRFGRDGFALLAARADLEVVQIGGFDDLSGRYFRHFGRDVTAPGRHHGIPVANWMICRKPRREQP